MLHLLYDISKVIFLDHCVKMKYNYQNRMEGVSFSITIPRNLPTPKDGLWPVQQGFVALYRYQITAHYYSSTNVLNS